MLKDAALSVFLACVLGQVLDFLACVLGQLLDPSLLIFTDARLLCSLRRAGDATHASPAEQHNRYIVAEVVHIAFILTLHPSWRSVSSFPRNFSLRVQDVNGHRPHRT